MDEGEFEHLLSEFFDGDLDAGGAIELQRLLEEDPARAALFVDLFRQSRALAPLLRPEESTFTRAVLTAVQRDERPFVRDVMTTVRTRRARRARPWVMLGAAAALALVAFASRSQPLARVVASGPRVTVVRDGRTLAAPAGFALERGDTLNTPAGETARVVYVGEKTHLDLEPLTELAFASRENEGKRLELRRGEVQAEVDHQPAGRPMVLQASHARAEVLGTRLKLSAVPDATRLEVQDGRVRLVRGRDGAAVEVSARQFTIADEDAALVAEPVLPPTSTPPVVTGFSLMAVDGPVSVPGFERLSDGAVVDLRVLAGRRFNLRAFTAPERVGSIRFDFDGDIGFNTETKAPYTLVPAARYGQSSWTPLPGRHTITATPYTGSYGNGLAGAPVTITITVVGDAP